MSLSIVDRLRIERAVWTIDFYTQDLPGRARRAIRRELRANLRSAAAEAGAASAVRRLGNLRRLGADYLDAEYGVDGPRPHWLTGLAWAVIVFLGIWMPFLAGAAGFIDGVVAAAPATAGDYVWRPLGGLAGSADLQLRPGDGKPFGPDTTFGLTITIWPLIAYLAVFLVAGRTWRLLGAWRRRRAARATQPSRVP